MIDLVISGAGSNGVMEAGAIDALKSYGIKIVRAGGASAGAINAMAICAELDAGPLWKRFLTRGNLEDWKSWPFRPLGVLSNGHGMIKGARIRSALKETLGEMTLADLKKPCKIVVGNLARRRIEVIDSENKAHQTLKCVDVLCCSLAVPFLIDAQQIRPDSKTLYTDGGTGANAPAGIMDDVPARPTVVIKFTNDENPKPVRSLKDMIAAVFDIRQDASNAALPSTKSDLFVLELPQLGNSLDFSLPIDVVEKLYDTGRARGELFARDRVNRLRV